MYATVSRLHARAKATANPIDIIRGEATCPICLGFFTDPVVTGCGHNFCRVCITHYWEGYANNFPCPQCRRTFLWKNIMPNRLLASVVKAAKLKSEEVPTPNASSLCKLHKEELKLYCHDDETAICMVCDCSGEHRYHSVIAIEEAAQDYKEAFQRNLEPLTSKSEDLAKSLHENEERVRYLKSEIEVERAHIKEGIEKLHQQLNDKMEVIAKLSQDLRNLQTFIDEVVAMCEQPAKEFIKGAKDILTRIHEEISQENVIAIKDDKDLSQEPVCSNRDDKDLSQEPVCSNRIQENLPEDPDGAIKKVIYDDPKTEKKLPEKKSRFLHKIHKILFSKRKKDNTSRDQDIKELHGRSAKALYDYEAANEDEISLSVGDIITQMTAVDEGWWYGKCNETFGMFPSNYVELL
ncbi:zinc finger protein RFP-like isoform X2 [Lissotriton helveticus]